MEPVYQTLFGGPDAPRSEQGNCLQAALASLFHLALEDVPHFIGLYGDEGWAEAVRMWLAERYGLCFMSVWYDPNFLPRGYTLLGGDAIPSGIPHVVVAYDGHQIHNPLGEGQEIVPSTFWIFYPLDPRQCATHGAQGPDYLEGMYILATGDLDGEV